jgi:hypothetical protein
MEAIRTRTTIKDHHLSIQVPQTFEDSEVEVIILRLEPLSRSQTQDRNQFLEFLRNGPTWSEEEIQEIEAVHKEFTQWTIPEF